MLREFLTCEKCGFNRVPPYARATIFDPVLCIGCRLSKAYTQQLENVDETLKSSEEYRQSITNIARDENKFSIPSFTETSRPLDYANFIMQNHKFVTLTDTYEILVYQDGIYNYDGNIIIEREMQKLAGTLCSQRLVSEVTGHIRRSTYIKRSFLNNDFSRLVLQDGILNLDTLEFSKGFDPKLITTIKIPIKYDSKATCPKFIKHLVDSIGSKENIIRVVEGIANILTTNNQTFEMMYIFHGSGSNGKSLVLKIIRGVFGGENCSSISIHSLANDKFALAHLDGKLVNLGGEISDTELTNTARLKQITSYESITVEKKGKDPFDMVPYAKHFYSTNKIPVIRDDTDSIYRRITSIKFVAQFLPGIDRIEDYDRVILQEEASGIFNLFLQNYKTLLRNRGFRYRQSIGEVREILKNESNRLRQFVSSCLVLNTTGNFIIKDTLFEKVRDFFSAYNYDFGYTKHSLTSELVRLGLTYKHNGKDAVKKINGKTVKVWLNVNWNFDNEWVKSSICNETEDKSTNDHQHTL